MYIHSRASRYQETFERNNDVDCKAQQSRKEQQITTS